MKFLKQVSLYTLVGVVSAGINFFVMPVLTHHLLPADYGMLALFNTYVTILLPIVSVSGYSLLSVDFFKQKDKNVFAGQFSSIQLIPLANALIMATLVWMFYGRFADDLELGGTGIKWGFIIVALTLSNIYYDQLAQLLVLQKKPGSFALVSLLRVGMEVGLTFYFIVFRGWNWEGRMYSWLIVSVLFFLVATIYFYREGLLRSTISWHHIREGIVFGSPLVLHGIGKFVVNQSDRLFIIKMTPNGLTEAGIYNIGYTVGSLVMIVVSAYFNFFTPYLMERLAALNNERKLQIVKTGYLYGLGSGALLILALLFSPLLFRYFIDPSYHGGLKYVFWVALGYCFWGGYMYFSSFIFYLKKSSILGWLAIFNVLTNLLFNYFFIIYFGAIGAAYATALSFFLMMVLVALIAQRLIPLPWRNYAGAKSVKFS